MSRHIAREVAFKIVFELAFQDEDSEALFERFFECQSEKLDLSEEDKKYAQEVVAGIKENLPTIDDKIKSKLKDWNFDRISKVDIAILRLAIYEICYRKDIPEKVSVNEAVEISKVFGEDSSSSFINGVLAEILKDK